MNFFGFRLVESNKGLKLIFGKRQVSWERRASQLIKDKVILDLNNAMEFLKVRGDLIVYKVFNLWKFVKNIKKIYERTKIACDLTLLKNGIFSVSDKGELFSTYGHLHKKEFGEAYTVLKNDCFLVLAEKDSQKTFLLLLKEGNSILIHPKFMHRLVSFKKDSLTLGFVPEKAGHDYEIVKNRGFPFHVFYNKRKDKIEILRNKKYKKGRLRLIEEIKLKVNPVNLFKKEPDRLKEILENPRKYEKLYFTGK